MLDAMTRLLWRMDPSASTLLETSLTPSKLDWSNKWMWSNEKQSSNIPSIQFPPIKCKQCLVKFVFSRCCFQEKTRRDSQNRPTQQWNLRGCLSDYFKREKNRAVSLLCKITCNLCEVSGRMNYVYTLISRGSCDNIILKLSFIHQGLLDHRMF